MRMKTAASIALALIVGCSAPDGKPILTQAQQSIAAAQKALNEGKWTQAHAEWAKGRSSLVEASDHAIDGKPLSAYAADADAAWSQKLDSVADQLFASVDTNPANAAAVEKLINANGSTQLRAKLQDRKKVWQAKAAAEAAATMAKTYFFWVEPDFDSDASDLNRFRTACLESLKKRFAPIPIHLMKAKPQRRPECAGTIVLRLAWDYVFYGRADSPLRGLDAAMPNDLVPSTLSARLTIASRQAKTSLDGVQEWTASAATPETVDDIMGTRKIRTKNRLSLLAAIQKNIDALPTISDPEGVARAIDQASQKPKPGILWTYRVFSRSLTDHEYAPKHDFARMATPIIDALQDRFAAVQLVDKDENPASPQGGIVIALAPVEKAYGKQLAKGINSISSSLPVSLTVAVEINPGTSQCNWPARKSFNATIGQPDNIPAGSLDAALSRSIQQLVDKVAADIRKEPLLELTAAPK